MKELEEVRGKIDQIILRCKAGEMTRKKARKQILNLKGNGWCIAIINPEEILAFKRPPIKAVIWQDGN